MPSAYTVNVYEMDLHKPSESMAFDLPFFCDDTLPKKFERTLHAFREESRYFIVELVDDTGNPKRLAHEMNDDLDEYLDILSEIMKFRDRAHTHVFWGTPVIHAPL